MRGTSINQRPAGGNTVRGVSERGPALTCRPAGGNTVRGVSERGPAVTNGFVKSIIVLSFFMFLSCVSSGFCLVFN